MPRLLLSRDAWGRQRDSASYAAYEAFSRRACTVWGAARDIASPDPVTGEIYATGTINNSAIPDGESVTETVPDDYVSDDSAQDVTVSVEADCDGTISAAADVAFVNTPLTDVTISVDSLVDGGTASTISCVDAGGALVDEDTANAPGDVSLTIENLEPTALSATLVCTIVVDP